MLINLILLFNMALPVESTLVWNNFNDGLERARNENKPVLIDVYTDWCGWCKTMDAKTYSDERVVKYLNEHFVLIRLNPETEQPVNYMGKQYEAQLFTQSLGVNGYPATAFFESDGKVVTVVPGYITAEDFLPIIQYMNEKKYYEISFQDYLNGRR